MKRKNNRNIKRLIIASAFLLLVGVVFFLFDPSNSAYYPKCIFHSLSGFDCPGCGSQRSLHHLVHFEIKEALFENPLFVLALPYTLFYLYLKYFGGKEKCPRIMTVLYGRKAAAVILIIIILFWIFRNLV